MTYTEILKDIREHTKEYSDDTIWKDSKLESFSLTLKKLEALNKIQNELWKLIRIEFEQETE